MRVGFAGLGRMGRPMARNLAAAGHDLTVWNRSPGAAEALAAEAGCDVAPTPAALAEGAEVVFTMLADDAASEAVHLGPEGLFARPGPRAFVEMGTVSPEHVAALASAAPQGARVIDAPVSGSTAAAEGAQLLVMAGCTAEAAAGLPFDAMARKVIPLGETGRGAVMKLAVNALIHGLNQTLAEAMTLAEAAGIAPELAFDVIENSAAAAPMLSYRRPLYLDEAAHDVTFTVGLAEKDMTLAAALAERLGVAMPQAEVTRAVLGRARGAGFAERDIAAILAFMREESR
ncbi:NAD(P)-dependent oxidoreductase [Jannaschia formosa]|uniref:NAD(P)-dependent oxidoreductase n=1 Tax=Jannaschia formosa TaxID=2259592 RepID=UPI000E1B6709|nr:NAD(P)-dependent oxidoreductase [Jannaschia formosa]TFL17207.1 NAD(P)-dependent oxidoreductase [Jannaschia formosa]